MQPYERINIYHPLDIADRTLGNRTLHNAVTVGTETIAVFVCSFVCFVVNNL